MTGVASAELSAERFNISQIVDDTVDQIADTVSNFTSELVNFVGNWIEEVSGEPFDSMGDVFTGGDFDFDAEVMPTFNYSFHMDIPSIPEVKLRFGFDAFELFMLLDTTLAVGTTYTYNLYASKSPLGFAVSDDLRLGVTFTADLILAVNGEIDISAGFHLKLEDGLAVDISLFDEDPSGIIL